MLVQYIRQNNKLIGAVVALEKDNIGWSVCRNGERFSKKLALAIAIGRAHVGSSSVPPVRKQKVEVITSVKMDSGVKTVQLVNVDVVSDAICSIKDRANRYFRD